MGKKHRGVWTLLVSVAALAVMLVVIPAFGEEHENDVLRLHVGTDGQYFQFDPVEGDAVLQDLPATQGCRLNYRNAGDHSLATLESEDRVGIHGLSLGVWSGGGQGVPCSRVDSGETLSVALGEANGSALIADAAELDLELKGGAHVHIQFSLDGSELLDEAFQVRSGSSIDGGEDVVSSNGGDVERLELSGQAPTGACRGDSDSGPDAGARDNCRVVIEPGVSFDEITFTVEAGEFSLEGSGDFGSDPAYDTIFHLITWDGTLACGDSVTRSDGDVAGTIIRHSNVDGGDCHDKLYLLRANDEEGSEDDSVIFEFDDPQDQHAFYEARVTFHYDLPDNVMLSGTLEYDPDGSDGYLVEDFVTMPACDVYPFEEPDPQADDKTPIRVDGDIPVEDIFPDKDDDTQHDGCVFFATQDMGGGTVWYAVFSGDWGFRPG